MTIATDEVDRDGTIIAKGAFGFTGFKASGAITKDSPQEELDKLPESYRKKLQDGTLHSVFTRIEPDDELAGDKITIEVSEEETEALKAKWQEKYMRNPVFSYGLRF